MSVGSIVNVVDGKIGDLVVQEGKLLYGVEDQVQSLRQELTMMSNFLIDIEEEQEEGGDLLTRSVINEIRQIAYDAEDVIKSDILKASSSNKTEAFFKKYVFFCSGCRHRRQVSSDIEAIQVRIAQVMENWTKYRNSYWLKENDGTRMRTPITTADPHTIEEHVVGLEEDIKKLVEVLIADETQINLVSIVGLVGSGKTTLARKLFKHESVKKYFDFMAWVAISGLWDTKIIQLELLRLCKVPLKKEETESVEAMTAKLYRYFERKRYLIVLDDVWTKQVLEEILPALQPSTKDGRKIIITTRNREVVDFPNLKCFFHEPRRLTGDESWELFRKIVGGHKFMRIYVFKALGKMLKKCGGLPLAAVAVADILAKKETLEEWEKVNDALSLKIMEQGLDTRLYGSVKEKLKLSYNDLPSILKPCFLYLVTFPEDYEIPTGRLCRMWIAEGFITSAQSPDGKTLEDVARECLEELISRYVVQAARRNYQGEVKTIRMIHQLVRDYLCIQKAKELNFVEILSSNSSISDERAEQLRRVAIHSKAS